VCARGLTAGRDSFTIRPQPDNERPSRLPSTASQIPDITDAERAVADLLPLGTDPESARRVLGRVPLWFHTFALNAEHGLYTPGVARDHRY
jgi:hypothetical protein